LLLLYLAAMWLIIPSMLLLTGYSILIIWYRQAWLSLPESNNNVGKKRTYNTKVSIVVPARNEANNIQALFKSLLRQNYPTHLLEILLIDDASEDDTNKIASDYSAQHSHIKVLTLNPDTTSKAHKKRAIEKGIEMATGSLIVATDADCTHSPTWVETLVSSFEEQQKVFIAAPVMYYTKPTFLSIFQTLDFLSLQGITGASVHRNFHTMCNGANIAYSRQAFYDVKGFEGIDNLPTGDDMLLMHKIYVKNRDKIVWLKNREALVTTDAAPSWKAFFQQRIRWASKAAFYDDKRIFYVLLLVYFLNVALLILGISAFFNSQNLLFFLASIVVKTVVELWFMYPVSLFFQKQKWLWFFPLFQPVHILYTVIAGWLGKFGKYEWKGREIIKN
jgi:cellulose synthase/poly-beta-1,6-N-acetylglucosamine synthase-like glycosyltransferase